MFDQFHSPSLEPIRYFSRRPPGTPLYHATVRHDERNQRFRFEARRGGTLLTKASFRYDAFNRRVASFADTDGDASDDVVTYQVYGGQAAWQLLGEYDGADDTANLLRSFVYGLYIDEVLSMRDHGSEEDFFYHQDDLFSVYALTDGDGAVVERYDYGDYGQVSIMEANGTPRAESAYGNRHAFTGRVLVPGLTLDDGSQILEYRHRYLHTASGRFVQRDPLSYIDEMNLYQYARVRPITLTDPMGEQSLPPAPIPATQPLGPGKIIQDAAEGLAHKKAACIACQATRTEPCHSKSWTPDGIEFESAKWCAPWLVPWRQPITWKPQCACGSDGKTYAQVFDKKSGKFVWVKCER